MRRQRLRPLDPDLRKLGGGTGSRRRRLLVEREKTVVRRSPDSSRIDANVAGGLHVEAVVDDGTVRRIPTHGRFGREGRMVSHASSNRIVAVNDFSRRVPLDPWGRAVRLSQRRQIAEHPETFTAMRRPDQVVAVNDQVVDRRPRQSELQRIPVLPGIVRKRRRRTRCRRRAALFEPDPRGPRARRCRRAGRWRFQPRSFPRPPRAATGGAVLPGLGSRAPRPARPAVPCRPAELLGDALSGCGQGLVAVARPTPGTDGVFDCQVLDPDGSCCGWTAITRADCSHATDEVRVPF